MDEPNTMTLDEVLAEETTVDPDRDIHEFLPSELDADDLLDIKEEFENIGLVDLAARIEIERGNALVYDGYSISFTAEETMYISMALNSAAHARQQQNRTDRLQVLADISERMLETVRPDDAEPVTVEVSDEAPTVDDYDIDE